MALAILLIVARLMGELAQRFSQPAVLGELIAGILLGPTFAGRLFPHFTQAIYPSTGPVALSFYFFVSLSIILFLLVAGMEVDLHAVLRQGMAAIRVAGAGMLLPFAAGLIAALLVPKALGREANADPLVFALFFATAMSISALPVIAKTLMDLYLYRTDLGMLVIAAAILNDLTGWIIFAVVLGMIDVSPDRNLSLGSTVLLTFGFAIAMVTVGRWIFDRGLLWVQARTDWPGGVLSFVFAIALLGAAFTEWCGVHAIFGSFLVGVAIGDSKRLNQRTREVLGGFISFIFGPIFFASIGLQVDFISYFSWTAVILVLFIACIGKILGCLFAARSSGLSARESWAIAMGMNSRGTMEIILGLLALQYHVISQKMFVALVIMAVVTSIMSGPLMQRILGRNRKHKLTSFLVPGAFIGELSATTPEHAISELCEALSESISWRGDMIESAVLLREREMPTGVGNAFAVPHAHLPGLAEPVIAVGISRTGIDFSSPDGEPARIIFLMLKPMRNSRQHLDVLSEIASRLQNHEIRHALQEARSFDEFSAVLRDH